MQKVIFKDGAIVIQTNQSIPVDLTYIAEYKPSLDYRTGIRYTAITLTPSGDIKSELDESKKNVSALKKSNSVLTKKVEELEELVKSLEPKPKKTTPKKTKESEVVEED